MGPGPNLFSDSFNNALVDPRGRLNLRITNLSGKWQCAEIVCQRSFGYGTYVFEIESPLSMNQNVVLGLFTWTDDCLAGLHNEMDVEFSKWGVVGDSNNAQFVVQPSDDAGHLVRFKAASTPSSHSFTWTSDRISFQSLAGSYTSTPESTNVLYQWSFSQADAIPNPVSETPRMNLWLIGGTPPSDGKEVEVIVSSFRFVPLTPLKLEISLARPDVLLTWPSAFSDAVLLQADTVVGPWTQAGGARVTEGDKKELRFSLLAPRDSISCETEPVKMAKPALTICFTSSLSCGDAATKRQWQHLCQRGFSMQLCHRPGPATGGVQRAGLCQPCSVGVGAEPAGPLRDKFLLAFSFAGEQRDLVRGIAEAVEKEVGRGKVFFDEWFAYYLAGVDADLKPQEIYGQRSELAVVWV